MKILLFSLFCCFVAGAPTYFNVGNTVTYGSARAFCFTKDMDLCTAAEVCVNGQPVNRPTGLNGDSWVPILDAFNDWVQLMDSRICKSHIELYGDPDWGYTSESQPYKGTVACCPKQQKTYSVGVNWFKLSGGITYNTARGTCFNKGLQLCSKEQICPSGILAQPPSPAPSSDNWVPIIDSYNNWVEIGSGDSRKCKDHISLSGVPSWGTAPNSIQSYKSYVACCSQKKIPTIDYYMLSTKSSYQDGWDFCTSFGRTLCAKDVICKGGKLQTVPDFPVTTTNGDMWVAIGDQYNNWVQVADSRVCQDHISTYGPPSWGTTAVSQPYKRILACCRDTDG